MKSCKNNGSQCCVVARVLSPKVDTLVIAFVLIGILITVNHAYADDSTSSSGTYTSSSGGSSGTIDSSSQSSSSSTSTTSDSSSSSNTDVNTPSTTGSSDTSSSSSSGPTNENQIPSNSENTTISNQTTGTSSNNGVIIDSSSISSTNNTTNSTDTTNSGDTNSTNSDNSTNNSNDTGSSNIIYVNSTDTTTESYTQNNSTNSSHHLLPILNHFPSKIIHHIALHKKIHNNNISVGTDPLQLDMLAIKANMVGQVEVKRVGNQTLLGFSGEEYFAKKISSTNNLKGFSLSTWVKPDYTRGSPQFTIVSKENAFVLGINNDIQPYGVAQFSIFNGIKWITVQSLTKIDDQKWTHLAATFNGNTSSIYVNGKLESSIAIEGIPGYSTYGLLETIPVQEISSGSSLVVGAYEESIRGMTLQHFSGLISDLKMYDLPLGDSTIAKISQTNLPNTGEFNSNY